MIPVVLHHGVLGFSYLRLGKFQFQYFSGGIETAIAERGHPLMVCKVHPTAGIDVRARQLKETILRQLEIIKRPDEQVIILAHSMGGLDARYMIAHLGMADRVRALATIATPHRGTPYADWCLKNLGVRLGGVGLARWLGLEIQALHDLTTVHCEQFNLENPDSPLVRYYSVSGARPWYKVPPFALLAWRIINEAEGDNDCLVSVKSSIWGKHLGVWPVDHFHEINKRLIFDPGGVGNVTPLYIRLLDEIAADGVDMNRGVIARKSAP